MSYTMREWLSGGVSPCQGEGRGFESRLALFLFLSEPLFCRGFRLFNTLLFGLNWGRAG